MIRTWNVKTDWRYPYEGCEAERTPRLLFDEADGLQNIYYMQMPRWLFSDPRYADMSLDAKVAYTFLLKPLPALPQEGLGQ